MVGVVSYKMFAMVVAWKKEDGRETILDQRDVDIGKVADAVVQTEYVCKEVSTKIRSISLLKFRERAVFPRCETSEGLCANARDFKLMSSIDYSNYLEGTRCFANELKGVRSKYCIFACNRWCKGMTERRKLRCQEPSRICSKLKIAIQKNRKIRCLFDRVLGLFRGRLYFTSSDKVVFEKSMSVLLSISLGYQLKRRKRRKRVVLKNHCEIFSDNNHQRLYKNIKLYNAIEWNPEPVYVNQLPLS